MFLQKRGYLEMQIEALLRPKVEVYSGLIALGASSSCLYLSNILLMTPVAAYASATLFLVLSTVRFSQAWKIHRYQSNLKRLPRYTMTSKQVPKLKNYTFLGKGFRFTQHHTQRIRDCMAPQSKKYIEQSSLALFAREFEKNNEHNWLAFLTNITKKDSVFNPVRPPPAVGGNPILHAVEPDEKDITIPLADRNQHMAVYGQTRVGKTRFAELLISQDIKANRGLVVFIDPKGDADMLARMYTEAKNAGREEDFVCFHLGFPEKSARYNAIGNFSRIAEISTRIADQLPNQGNSSAFREFAWRFVNIVATALVALNLRPDYIIISRYVTNVEPLFVKYAELWVQKTLKNAAQGEIDHYAQKAERLIKSNPRAVRCTTAYAEGLRMLLEERKDVDIVLEGLLSAMRYERSFYEKIVASLLPFLQKLITGKTAEILNPNYGDVDDERPIFDWESAIRGKKIVYIGLDAMSSRDTASAIGNAMLADLLSVSAQIYRTGIEDGMLAGRQDIKPEIYVHADEFNEIAGDESVSLSNKAAGAGVRLVIYTQSRDDAVARMQDISKSRQLESNFGSLVMLRVKSKNTAELLTDQLPEVEISLRMTVSGANDNSDVTTAVDFTSSTQDRVSTQRVPIIQPSDLTSLPKGQAFALINGGELYKIRFPLPVLEPEMPKNFADVADKMRRRYQTADDWWLVDDERGYVAAERSPHLSTNEI